MGDDRASFEFTYRGIPEPVKAKVNRGGRIEVQDWPKRMEPALVLPRSLDFAKFTDEFCAGVEANAKAGRLDAVRNRGSVVASVESMPFASVDFANAAKRGALDALGGVGAPFIANEPGLEDIRVRVVLAEGAISANLGTAATLESIFTRTPVALDYGTWNGEISAMDLLCDLRAGKAKIVFEAITDEGGYAPVSEVSSLGGPT